MQLVVIGSSAGGIRALSELGSTLPGKFSAPIIIVQYLDPAKRAT
jgi:chemotaxis response regulator CheB